MTFDPGDMSGTGDLRQCLDVSADVPRRSLSQTGAQPSISSGSASEKRTTAGCVTASGKINTGCHGHMC
jgi:hypothetical protein